MPQVHIGAEGFRCTEHVIGHGATLKAARRYLCISFPSRGGPLHQMQPGHSVKLALVVLELSVGGLERAMIRLANGLVSRGVPTRVIILEGDKYNSLTLACELRPEVEILDLTGPLLKKLCNLRQLTEGHLVHLHFWGGNVRPLYQIALIGRTVIATYQNDYTQMIGRTGTILNRLCALRYETVIAVSDTVRHYCVSKVGIPANMITTIQNAFGQPPPQWFPRNSFKGTVHFITIARLAHQKNHSALLRGMAIAVQKGFDCKLTLVGDGPEMASLVVLANRLNLRSHIQWYGELWPSTLVQMLLASADVFVNASLWEGNPIAVLEAAAAGMPLLLSDIPPHRDIGQTDALYFDPLDPHSLACQMMTVGTFFGDDPQRRNNYRIRTLERFSSESLVEMHLVQYRRSCKH